MSLRDSAGQADNPAASHTGGEDHLFREGATMWRWIAAATVMTAMFGLGIVVGQNTTPSRIETVVSWDAQTLPPPQIGFVDDIQCFPTAPPQSHVQDASYQSESPVDPRIAREVDAIAEIRRRIPAAAAGTVFENCPATEKQFFATVQRVAAESEAAAPLETPPLESSCLAPAACATDQTTCPRLEYADPSSETNACAAGTCATSTCAVLTSDTATCDAASAPCSSETATCPQTSVVNRLLSERARDLETQAWELEHEGRFDLADALWVVVTEMRTTARRFR